LSTPRPVLKSESGTRKRDKYRESLLPQNLISTINAYADVGGLEPDESQLTAELGRSSVRCIGRRIASERRPKTKGGNSSRPTTSIATGERSSSRITSNLVSSRNGVAEKTGIPIPSMSTSSVPTEIRNRNNRK